MRSTRRTFCGHGGAATVMLAKTGVCHPAFAELKRPASRGRYLTAARRVSDWITANRLQTAAGLTWPADPSNAKFDASSLKTHALYSDSPGVVLFLLALYQLTRERGLLEDAQAGADHLAYLMAERRTDDAPGLYDGMAGLAFVFEQVHRVSGASRHRVAATQCMEAVRSLAKIESGRAYWNSSNDIVSGTAGIGLALLWWSKVSGDSTASQLAEQAGRALIHAGERTPAGLQWRVRRDYPRLMPNFSHGTAGVAYFLARLHGEGRGPMFLEAASAGAAHLLAVADTREDACKIYHHTKEDGTAADLYYWSWCHGPVGTWRLFHQLGRTTQRGEWDAWVHRCARAVLASGLPEQRLPGFWNNFGQCCGDAGVGRGFLDLYGSYGRAVYLRFAHRIGEYLVQRALTDEQGMRWQHAENRTAPDAVSTQTGLMQGAAGIGLYLLQLHSVGQRRALQEALPDSPFAA